jgi:hypothetical protein
VLLPLTQGLVAAAMLLAVVALGYALFDKLINDWLLGLAALVELGVVVQLVRGLVGIGELDTGERKATFAAYLVTLPFVLALTLILDQMHNVDHDPYYYHHSYRYR